MPISRDMMQQIHQHVIRPIATRIANSLARAVVQLIDDSKQLQMLQLGVLVEEDVDDVEHHQPYGFSSVPLAGAEAIVVFPNGDRGHPLCVVASDRRYRPTGGAAGTVSLYNHVDARVVLLPNGTIEARSAAGAAVSLATKADVQALTTYLRKQFAAVTGHTHTSSAPGNPTVGVVEAAGPDQTGTAPAPSGTSRFKAE